jgi:hypothetical protein
VVGKDMGRHIIGGWKRRCPASASCAHIGQEKQTALESSHRDFKGLVDLVQS